MQDTEETNAIFLAVCGGAPRKKLEELVEGGVDFRETNKWGGSILHVAAREGNLEAVAYFLSMGLQIDFKDNLDMTPLMEAAIGLEHQKFVATVDFLVENGADINAENNCGKNVLMFATSFERPVKDLKALMSRGANWKSSSNSALHVAVEEGYVKGIKLFISKGADVNLRNGDGKTPLMIAALEGVHFRAVVEALETGGELDWQSKDAKGNNILHCAADGGNVEAVKRSIAKGVNVNGRNEKGETPLMKAATAIRNFVEVVSLLVESGADISAVDNKKKNVVMLATLYGKTALEVDHLVKLGGDLEARDDSGESVLHVAARYGNLEVVQYLIGEGEDE